MTRARGVLGALAALLLAAAPAWADAPPSDVPPPVTDPAQVAQHLHQVLAEPQFRDEGDTGMNPHLEDLLSQWFKELGARMGEFKYASQMPAFESLLMTLLVALSIAILLYIVVRLTRRHAWTGGEAPAEPPGEKAPRPPEFYDDEIARAVAGADWHAAWLATWRQFLSRLEQRSLVEADRTRTNREYLERLRGQSLPATAQALLARLVDAYDRSIYGHAAIGEGEWDLFRGEIEEAALLLHLDDRAPAPRPAPAA
ncbi:MAG: DUF4129 domain-containing protein [Verrucomicrobiota bacterium]